MRETSATCQLNPGYKQTDVGTIPEDWLVRKIGAVCTLVNGRGFKPYEWRQTGIPIIRIQNLNGSEDFNCYTGSYDRKLEVEAGQLLFAWSGSRGTSFGPHIWRGPFGLLNYHTWKIQVNEFEVSSQFFFYALKQLTTFIEGKAHGASALVHTQKWEMEGFKVSMPPSKAEQEVIATALRDAEALVESLEQLLTKKRQIKQGAMQALLTGNKRLPGFSGDWSLRSLKEILEVPVTDGPHSTPKFLDQGIPFLSVNNLVEGQIDWSEVRYISVLDHKEFSRKCKPRLNDVLLGKAASVGKVAIVNADIDFNIWSPIALIRVKEDWSARFVYYQLQSPFVEKQIALLTNSSSQGNIGMGDIEKLSLMLPSAQEQSEIAELLADMDSELLTLEAKITKVRQLKQGMMQELLTGRVRLI